MEVTKFAIPEKYAYLEGVGNYHSSEAIKGATPVVINSPQKPPYGLLTERLSNTSFTAPRSSSLHTFLYRVSSSLDHTEIVPHGEASPPALSYTPNSYFWPLIRPWSKQGDWTQQALIAKNGDAMTKSGLSIWLFDLAKDMPARTAFTSLDGDALIIPQSGALELQTEFGHLLVRQNEIAVIPRAVKYRVTLAASHARGYVCELYQSHFQLPDLGIMGTTGLANARDFQVPVAAFEGSLVDGKAESHPANAEWTVILRQNSTLWRYKQDHTPFDVVAWHGTCYPYKYDLARFCVMGNLRFDEHDPSMFVVLTAPSHGDPGSAVADFAIIPPRWNVADKTLAVPYYHRNTMSEFFGAVVHAQEARHPLNQIAKKAWVPFAAGVNPPMKSHGSDKAEMEKMREASTKPTMLGTEGFSVMLLETERPLYLADWAKEAALVNFKAEKETRAKSSL